MSTKLRVIRIARINRAESYEVELPTHLLERLLQLFA